MPYTVVEKVLLLQNVDLLAAARTEDLAVLASIAEEILYPEGATVFEEGQPADGLYVVIRGELVLTRGGHEVDRVGEKAALGAWDLIEGGPESSEVMRRKKRCCCGSTVRISTICCWTTRSWGRVCSKPWCVDSASS